MTLHLFNLLLVALVLVNTTGVGLLAARWIRLPFGLAQAAGLLLGCSVFFFVEHVVGLGSLGWILPLSTVGSGWLIYQARAQWQIIARTNIWLLIGFAYV